MGTVTPAEAGPLVVDEWAAYNNFPRMLTSAVNDGRIVVVKSAGCIRPRVGEVLCAIVPASMVAGLADALATAEAPAPPAEERAEDFAARTLTLRRSRSRSRATS